MYANYGGGGERENDRMDGVEQMEIKPMLSEQISLYYDRSYKHN